MTEITDQTQFKQALESLDATAQRVVAARFVKDVLSLSDDPRIASAMAAGADAGASETSLADALRAAKAATIDSHTRCGAECDWAESAGYFVARAAVAALTPKGQIPGGPAWQAAMSSRMARTSESIATGTDVSQETALAQYRILSEFLSS
jgi:hypothetical protein